MNGDPKIAFGSLHQCAFLDAIADKDKMHPAIGLHESHRLEHVSKVLGGSVVARIHQDEIILPDSK